MATVLNSIRKYVPAFGENDKKPEKDQITVFVRNVDVETRQKQLRKFITMPQDRLMQEMIGEGQSGEIQELLKKHVVALRNMVTTEPLLDEKGNPQFDEETGDLKVTERPSKIDDVILAGEWMFLIDLFMNILQHSQLQPEKVKNSEPQSGSQLPVREGMLVQ